jgi:hypothetical protein
MGIPKLLLTGSDVWPGAMPNLKSPCPLVILDEVEKLNSVPEEGIPNLKEAWFAVLPGTSFCVTS